MSSYSFLQQDPRFLQQQQTNAQPQRQQPGFQNGGLQPQQTGFVQQPQGGYPQQQQPQQQQPSFMQSQPTGYMQPQQTGYMQQQPQRMQPNMTGFAPGGQMAGGGGMLPQRTGYMQPQATGFPGGGMGGGGMPAMPSLPAQYQGQQQSNLAAPNAGMNSRFMSSPAPLSAQPTGYPMGYGGQMPAIGASSQPFLNTFMPAPGVQQPQMFSGGFQPSQMQFAQPTQQQSLQQTFQQQNQQQSGQAEVKVPWKLSSDEKKSYDQIFRAWDQQGTGFIDGKMSVEVFAQSGLGREDLMKIWGLADVANRGKLNLAEFHVAMGLIYRCLNGNSIPDVLPPELTPPSARDLDNSVDFLKDLLKKDTNARSAIDAHSQQTRGPTKSLHSSQSGASKKDATMYRFDDSDSERTYQSRSRHIDRRNVRHAGQDKAAADLDEMKRELDKTDSMLESSRNKDDDDEGLDQELEDLKYKIRRVQDDIDYIARSGRRTEAKDDERRKLERELLRLRHEDLPEIEKKIEDRERERRRDANRYARDRDSRNNRGRFDDRDRDRDREYGRESPERGYLRGSYDRDTPSRGSGSFYDRDTPSRSGYDRDTPSRSPYDRDTPSRGGSSYRDRDRLDDSRSSIRSPPPAPPAAPAQETRSAPPRPPSAPAASKNMTPEEKKAFIQAEAQRRIQERLRSLGLGGSAAPAVDKDVASRMEQDKAEAAERSAKAEKEAEERDNQRRIRLEEERLARIRAEEELNNKAGKAITQVKNEMGSNVAQSKTVPSVQAHAAMRDEISKEEVELRAREEALAKEKAERVARLKRLEEEEAESQRLEEEFARKKAMFGSRAAAGGGAKKVPPPPPASRRGAGPPPPPAPRSVPPAASFAPPPPAPPAPAPLFPVLRLQLLSHS